MLLSRKVLCNYAPQFKNVSFDKLNNACINLGMEIEKVYRHPSLNKDFCIGLVKNVYKINNSDHLQWAEVLVNESKNIIKKIVCGASNLKANMKVIVANVGAKLYDGKVITKKNIMGIDSQGMMCGYFELTPLNSEFLDNCDAHGIIKLDDSVKLSDDINKILGFDDEIYDITIPSNRYDLNGAYFLINELAQYFGFKLLKLQSNNLFTKNTSYRVTIDKKNTTNYSLVIINNYKYEYSEWNIKKLMLNSGVKTSNYTIDIINWITYLTGIAPLIFDKDRINENINQCFADNQSFIFNNKKYLLTKNDLVWENNGEIIGIDGVCVNDKFGISKNTNGLLLLIDNTRYSLPRNSSIKHNISNITTKYSSKKCSLTQMNLFLNLINTHINKCIFVNPIIKLENDISLPFNKNEFKKFCQFKNINIGKVLKKLGFKLCKDKVLVPGYRSDLTNEYDIYEEIIKYVGIELNLESPANILVNSTKDEKDEYYFVEKLKTLLTNNYFYEVRTYNLTSKEELNKWNLFNLKTKYEISPCSNKMHQFMRLGLVNNMVKVMEYNANRKNELIPIFEIQKIYNERNFLNLTCLSPYKYSLDEIHGANINYNTFGLKSILKEISKLFNANLTIEHTSNPYLTNNDSLAIKYKNELIGYIGNLKNNLLKSYKLHNQDLYVLSINLNKLIKDYNESEFNFKKISNLVPVIKDITFHANNNTNIQKINDEIDKLEFVLSYKYIKSFNINQDTIAYTIHILLKNSIEDQMDKKQIDNCISTIINIITKNKGLVRGV